MRLLVTGGAGFIGSTFVRRRLRSTADEIAVLDKLTYAGNRANLADLEQDPRMAGRFRFVQGDIAVEADVDRLVESSDAVVNFAAESHVDRSILGAEAFLRTGVIGVHVLLEAIRRVASHKSIRLVQVSTDEVYGSVESGLSRESDPVDPRSPYAAAKAAGELLALSYHATYGADVVVTRGSNTYGPHQHVEKLIPLFITNAMDDQPLPLYGDGLQRRDWLFVDDHADAIGFVLDRGEAGEVYNIPGREERTNWQVTERILEHLGKPTSLVRRVPDRLGHDRRYALDGEKLALLGWTSSVPFAAGLTHTVDWFRQNEAWWRRLKSGDWEEYYSQQYGHRLAESADA